MLFKHSVVLGMLLSTAAAQTTELLEIIRNTSVKAGPLLPITQEKAQLLAFAAELTEAVYYKDPDTRYPEYTHLSYVNKYGSQAHFVETRDEVDANLFMDVGDYCFVTWRATLSMNWRDPVTWKDWLYRNADVETRHASAIDGDGTTCAVLEGIYEAYQGGELMDNALEDDIINFVEGCMSAGSNKQLVLTGHSQGAGAAMVGALRLGKWNPLTIALAGAPFLKNESADCSLVNPEHIWRVVNTENEIDGTHLLLDSVPMSGLNEHCATGTDIVGPHVGPSIHLPPDDPAREDVGTTPGVLNPPNNNLVYFSPAEAAEVEENYGPDSGNLSGGNEAGGSVHWVETGYLPKLKNLALNGPFPLNVDGYVDGTACTGDHECINDCVHGYCASDSRGCDAESGRPLECACDYNAQCASGDCASAWEGWSVVWTCQEDGFFRGLRKNE